MSDQHVRRTQLKLRVCVILERFVFNKEILQTTGERSCRLPPDTPRHYLYSLRNYFCGNHMMICDPPAHPRTNEQCHR